SRKKSPLPNLESTTQAGHRRRMPMTPTRQKLRSATLHEFAIARLTAQLALEWPQRATTTAEESEFHQMLGRPGESPASPAAQPASVYRHAAPAQVDWCAVSQ